MSIYLDKRVIDENLIFTNTFRFSINYILGSTTDPLQLIIKKHGNELFRYYNTDEKYLLEDIINSMFEVYFPELYNINGFIEIELNNKTVTVTAKSSSAYTLGTKSTTLSLVNTNGHYNIKYNYSDKSNLNNDMNLLRQLLIDLKTDIFDKYSIAEIENNYIFYKVGSINVEGVDHPCSATDVLWRRFNKLDYEIEVIINRDNGNLVSNTIQFTAVKKDGTVISKSGEFIKSTDYTGTIKITDISIACSISDDGSSIIYKDKNDISPDTNYHYEIYGLEIPKPTPGNGLPVTKNIYPNLKVYAGSKDILTNTDTFTVGSMNVASINTVIAFMEAVRVELFLPMCYSTTCV